MLGGMISLLMEEGIRMMLEAVVVVRIGGMGGWDECRGQLKRQLWCF